MSELQRQMLALPDNGPSEVRALLEAKADALDDQMVVLEKAEKQRFKAEKEAAAAAAAPPPDNRKAWEKSRARSGSSWRDKAKSDYTAHQVGYSFSCLVLVCYCTRLLTLYISRSASLISCALDQVKLFPQSEEALPPEKEALHWHDELRKTEEGRAALHRFALVISCCLIAFSLLADPLSCTYSGL